MHPSVQKRIALSSQHETNQSVTFSLTLPFIEELNRLMVLLCYFYALQVKTLYKQQTSHI
jgi:hypothetical protein